MQAEIKVEINHFNEKIEESLDDTDFVVNGEDDFESMYLEDMDEDSNMGISHRDIGMTPSAKEYDDMNIKNRPEAINKYLKLS